MTLKIFGAILIVLGCGGFGFAICASHKREASALQQLIVSLTFMQNELSYRMPNLSDLCRATASAVRGVVANFWLNLANELDQQISPNVRLCMLSALSTCHSMPKLSADLIRELANSMGKFDISGQLAILNEFKKRTELIWKQHTENQELRLRSYQTLGICAGAAVVIIFI